MTPSIALVVLGVGWAVYLLATGQPSRASAVITGLVIYLGVRWLLRKALGLDKA